ncbi:AraC family transcriptional regulator [Pararhodonellum marinum]|uniref:AraC family transcriptional regulator n=1 Tax=Pararhodonellum marinum TaxID=2755358 RepID=UPI00188E7786|nr:GyrI-like domain-containing protein [Pararhodonellum marinum]
MLADNPIYQQSLIKSINYIESNLDKKILLKEIAKEAHISEFHFHRIFKALTGETVKEHVSRLKLERAALHLKHNKEDIGQIAFQHGYENHESFTRAFKKHFRLTPQEYKSSIHQITLKKQTIHQNAKNSLSKLHLEEPKIKLIPDLHLAYLRHTGSYEKVGKTFQRLMLWAATHLVLKFKPSTLGIVHDNPDLTEEDKIRFDACVQLTKAIKPKGEISFKTIKGGKYAVFRYQGPYDNFYKVYDYIYNVCLFEKKWELSDQPALEWYVKSPPFYKPDQYVTDFCVPIK